MSETRADRAEAYITRVQELDALNMDQAAELNRLREEIISLQGQLENCTSSNLELSRQLATLTEQLEAEVRLRQQDFDRVMDH